MSGALIGAIGPPHLMDRRRGMSYACLSTDSILRCLVLTTELGNPTCTFLQNSIMCVNLLLDILFRVLYSVKYFATYSVFQIGCVLHITQYNERIILKVNFVTDGLFCVVVSMSDCHPRGPEFDFRLYPRDFSVYKGLERGSPSLVRTIG